MKRVAAVLLAVWWLATGVRAENGSYQKQYEASGASALSGLLDEETRRLFAENGVDPAEENWVDSLTVKGVFSHLLDLLRNGAKEPLTAGAKTVAVLLLAAAFTAFGGEEERYRSAGIAAVAAVAVVIGSAVWQTVSASVSAVRISASFLLGFVPIFIGVVALSGQTLTAAASGGMLLLAAEGVSTVCSFGVLPLMGGYLAVSIAGGVSPLLSESRLAETVKKISLWGLSLVSTVFLGVLGTQTALHAAADSVGIRTAKFFLGTSVPVAGQVLSEAVGTIAASVSLLRSSLGLYAVVALAAMLLPLVVELLLWRAVLLGCGTLARLFAQPKIDGLLQAVDGMLAFLLGAILLIGGLFVLSLIVVMTGGKSG